MEAPAAMQQTTSSEKRLQRTLDYVVAFKWLAATGALFAAIAPAVMATAEGDTLRASISDYWDIDPRHLFWAPFTAAAVLLFLDGIISYVSPNRKDYGGRWYNLLLGVSLYLLTWFDKDTTPEVHFPAAVVFFGLFIAVIAYTSFLGWTGRHVGGTDAHDEAVEQAGAQVSLVFLLLLLLTLVAWVLGLISFFFFEVFALVNFALYYVQGSLRAFPYPHYEFPFATLNRAFRLLKIMRPPG